MEVSGKRLAGSEDVNTCILCDPCQLDNDEELAVSYCTDCNEYLCDACTGAHRKSKASRHHQLLAGDEMPRRKLRSVEEKFCSKHHKGTIKFFCFVFICSVCVILGHALYGIEYIKYLTQGFDTSKDYRDLQKLLREIEQLLAENKNKSDKNSEAAEKNYNHLFTDIKTFWTEINTTLDVREKRIEEKIVREVSFLREEAILKTLSSCDNLGKLEIIEDTERRTEKYVRRDEIEKTPKPTIPIFVKKIDIHNIYDKYDCFITGSVLMNGDTIGLVDRENSLVKVVDLHKDTLTSYIRLDDEPWDLTCIDPNTLVVTSYSKLTYLRYDRKLSIIKHVPMEAGCTGITYSNNKLYVTFTGNQPAVRILNTDGNILKTFIIDSLGQKLFRNPKYITTSTDGQTIYVTDYDKHELTCLNMQGHVESTHTHNDLRYPLGVTIDDNNIIYVAGLNSQNIHRISSRCEHIQILLDEKDGMDDPRTVLYNNKNGMMYISQSGYTKGDFLYVFKLQ